MAALGPVEAVACAAPGDGDLVHMVLRHDHGAASTLSTSLSAPEGCISTEIVLWGADGRSVLPSLLEDTEAKYEQAARLALRELLDVAGAGGTTHPCDASFGAEMVRVVDEIERMLHRSPAAS